MTSMLPSRPRRPIPFDPIALAVLIGLLLVGGSWAPAVAQSPSTQSNRSDASNEPNVHPHYQGLLRNGVYAFERGEAASAASSLELACFGMLDHPRDLTDCLARLALAQAAQQDIDGFEDTFRRLIELEERFDTVSQGALSPSVRRQLGAVVKERISESVLTETGGAFLLPSAEAESDEVILARGRAALASVAKREDLERALDEVAAVAERRPDDRAVQHLAATLAYRASRWQQTVDHFRRGGEPERAELLFYYAVALYETGDLPAATRAMERSLPGLEKTPFVESYRKKILDRSARGDGGAGAGTP